MKQLFKEQELIGKTISQVIFPKESYQDAYIKFSDNSFIVLDIKDVTVGYGQERNLIVISDLETDDTDENLVKLGLISKSSYEIAVKKQEENFEKSERERQNKWQEETIRLELEKLQELKKKYE